MGYLCDWDNSINLSSKSYNLAKSEVTLCGDTKCLFKNYPINIDVDAYT